MLYLGFLESHLIKHPPAMLETPVGFLQEEDPPEKGYATHSIFMGSPGGSAGKESACNVGDLGWIPGLGKFPGGGYDNPLQYSCLENPMDRGAWCVTMGSQRDRHD